MANHLRNAMTARKGVNDEEGYKGLGEQLLTSD